MDRPRRSADAGQEKEPAGATRRAPSFGRVLYATLLGGDVAGGVHADGHLDAGLDGAAQPYAVGRARQALHVVEAALLERIARRRLGRRGIGIESLRPGVAA